MCDLHVFTCRVICVILAYSVWILCDSYFDDGSWTNGVQNCSTSHVMSNEVFLIFTIRLFVRLDEVTASQLFQKSNIFICELRC